MKNETITFGTLVPDGSLANVRLLRKSDVERCPFYILLADHYRDDGSCKCNDAVYRKTVMRRWGYRRADFIRAGIVKKRR